MTEKLTAAILTLAHMERKGPAEHDYDKKYAHNEVVDEFEAWVGYLEDDE